MSILLTRSIYSLDKNKAENSANQAVNFHLIAEQTSLSIPTATELLEKQMITEALNRTNGNKSKASKLLEISERALWYKVSKYNL